MKKSRIVLLTGCVGVIGLLLMLTTEVTYKQGINFQVQTIRIPLYLKVLDFFGRHYHYKNLAGKIIDSADSDTERALKILSWIDNNIRVVPQGYPIVDDHIWHIVIRGYGTMDQCNDLFTTLCAYAGLRAFWRWASPKDSTIYLPLSYVEVNKRWLVFDPYYGNYFRNKDGAIASVDDIILDLSLVKNPAKVTLVHGIVYERYFENLKPIGKVKTARVEKQVPLKRLFYEITRRIGPEKEKDYE